jgi:hypothetical protein
MSELVAFDKLDFFSDQKPQDGNTWETGYWKNTRNTVRHPLKALQLLSQFSEQMTRIGEFGRAVRGDKSLVKGSYNLYKETYEDIRAKRKGEKMQERPISRDIMMEGGLAARDVSVDFGRMGVRGKAFNRITAFFNANLEGTDRMARVIAENPGRVLLKGAIGLTIPTLMLRWANEGEYGYDKIPGYQKNLFWVFPIPMVDPDTGEPMLARDHDTYEPRDSTRVMNHWIRVPKPWAYGMFFATMPEKAFDFIISKDPYAFDDFGQDLLSVVGTSFAPQALIAAVEPYSNKSFFTGSNIIPQGQEGMLPLMQHTPATTSVSRKVGELLSSLGPLDRSVLASPPVLENAVRNLTGGLGAHVLNGVSKVLEEAGVLPVPPERRLTKPWDVVGLKAFSVNTAGWTEQMSRVYDTAKDIEQVHKSYKSALKNGDRALAERIKQRYQGSAFFGNAFASTYVLPTLSKLTSVYHRIALAENHFSTREQTQRQDQIRNQQHGLAVQWERDHMKRVRQWEKRREQKALETASPNHPDPAYRPSVGIPVPDGQSENIQQ